MDIGSAVGRDAGVTEEQLADLGRFEESDAFSPVEKLVLRLAVALTRTPTEVTDELFEAVQREFSPAQIVELTATVAWENFRARFNRAFDIESQDFSEGALCPIPEHLLAPSSGAPEP